MEKKVNPEEVVSLLDLAKELDENKTRLQYYARKGLIDRVGEVGSTYLYNKRETKERLEKIIELRNQGFKLDEIKEKIDENNQREN